MGKESEEGQGGRCKMSALTRRAIRQVHVIGWVEFDGAHIGVCWQGKDAVLLLPLGAPQPHCGRREIGGASSGYTMVILLTQN